MYLPRRRLAVASPSPRRRLALASTSPRRRLAVALPSSRRRLAPPFAHHRHHHIHVRCRPTRTATATAIAIGIIGRYPYRCCCHHQRRSSRRPSSPLPPSPLYGCVRRARRSGGTATPPAVIRDGPDGHTTKTRYGTASAAASAATEEEECDGCDGADPRRRLEDSLIRLADGILLRSIVATRAGAAATAVGSTVITTMLMPVIDFGTLFIGWEDRKGDDGSGVATEDDDDTDVEAGGYARDFLEVILR